MILENIVFNIDSILLKKNYFSIIFGINSNVQFKLVWRIYQFIFLLRGSGEYLL